ncbi:MAG: AmmeMemoRadiSam system protein A [Gemmatimonadales bacterium]
MSPEARHAVYRHVVAAVKGAVTGESVPELPDLPELDATVGVFVTLTKNGELRGCIGRPYPDHPLRELLGEVAADAAVSDPRFPPVTSKELAALEYEVSILTIPRAINPNDLEVGRQGAYIRRGAHRGLLLPQVATDWKMNRIQFLEALCHKAGLPGNAWQDPDTVVEAFEAEVFGE